jgi:uncharacterized protein
MTLTHAPAPRASVASKALRALVLAYQAASAGRSPACRFVPSCSEYALEAIDRFGARKGFSLAVRRLARCRPGGPFGLDPVPDGPSSEGTSSEEPDCAGQIGPGRDAVYQDAPYQEGASQESPSQESPSPGVYAPSYPGPAGQAIDHLVAPAGSGAEKRTA